MQHLQIRIRGRVQGVSFRAATKAVADQLKIRGIIRNEADGSLYIEAEGDDQMMEQFLEWCQEGPDYAIVESVETTAGIARSYRNFEVVK